MACRPKRLPRLPKELRDIIWEFVVENAQQRCLGESRAHFFPLFRRWEDAAAVNPNEALLYEDGEILWEYGLAAPRLSRPGIPGSWQDAEIWAREMEWIAYEESMECAFKHAKSLGHEVPYEPPNTSILPSVHDNSDSDEDFMEEHEDEESESEDNVPGENGSDGDVVDEANASNKVIPETRWRRCQSIVRFEANGEELLLPINSDSDLLVLRPLVMSETEFYRVRDCGAIDEFGSRNFALEFDPSWGYPVGPDAWKYYWIVDPPQPPGAAFSRRQGPLQFIKDLALHFYSKDPSYRLWFIDYRIRLVSDATVDERLPVSPRTIFYGTEHRYISVDMLDPDWVYADSDGGMDVFRYIKDLAPPFCEPDNLGVLACMPLKGAEQ